MILTAKRSALHDITSFMPEDLEYPHDIAERGVPNNTLYSYVSTTFLNGYINYVQWCYGMLIERYSRFDEEKLKHLLDYWAAQPHSDYREAPVEAGERLDVLDDVWILGQTKNCWWFFWSDMDVSDSCIGRFSKDAVPGWPVVLAMTTFLARLGQPESSGITGRYVELSEPKGWIRL